MRADGAFAPTCSASVIGPRAVLTASHCIEAFSGRAATGFGIALGEIRSLHIIRASAVAEFPGFFEGNNRLFNDLSIVTLSADTGITPLAVLASRSPAAGDTGLVYGYGKRSEGTDEEADIFTNLVSGTMQVQNVTSNHIFVSYNGSGSNVCNGDSGGPILLSSPQGGFAIAGVVSVGSVEGCRAGDTTTFTNATSAQFLNFISAHAAGVTFK